MAKRPKKYATELDKLADTTRNLPAAPRDSVIALVRSLIRTLRPDPNADSPGDGAPGRKR